jgi:uncharacterized protein YggT (Ycf19 family)
MNITYMHIYYLLMSSMFIVLILITLGLYVMFMYMLNFMFWFNSQNKITNTTSPLYFEYSSYKLF